MDALRLKVRQPVEAEVENWDDDDFLIESDDITFRSNSTVAPGTSHRRDSHSSFRSDLESIVTEEERQVHLPGDDEKSTLDAIAAARNAGIPIPKNVPPSALMGGTIKRLGGKKIKKIFQEDWGDDLEFPDAAQALRIKPQDGSKFPEVLRQVSGSTQASPAKPARESTGSILDMPQVQEPTTIGRSSINSINLDRFRDTDEDDDFFGDGGDTIKVSKSRQPPKPISLITPPTPRKSDKNDGDDDFEKDLELPSDGKLKLSKRRDIPKTPALNTLDDFDWGEGSLGTRFGGTRRDGRSNRSSSVSALSPSVSSSITAESECEDDAFDGLVLPTGPVDFEERLKRRRQSPSPQRPAAEQQQPAAPPVAQPQQPQRTTPPSQQAEKEDFLAGLEIGDGDVFESNRRTLHRNVRIKETRPASPARIKTAVSLTFTNKPVTGISRLPRPLMGHERTHTASSLEPVSESGGPIYSNFRRSQSRMGHSAQSSVSSIPTPATPSSAQSSTPTTPRPREIGQKASMISLRTNNEPTTTSAQLLRLKRSLPAMRQPQTPGRPLTSGSRAYERPPSRTEGGYRPQSAMRPKTPVERTRAGVESAAAQARKNPLPFLPAGASQSQSHHISAKSSRVFRRHDSDTAVDFRPTSRAVSRSAIRSPSPNKRLRLNGEKVAADGVWQQINKPRRLRHFGDGHELDGFDDLPTSTHHEAQYVRQPIAPGPKMQLRSKVYQNILPDRTNTPSPLGLYSPARAPDNVPHFARDTAASRIARETSLAQRTPSGPLAPLTAQRVSQLSTRANYNATHASHIPHLPHQTARSKRSSRKPQQLKPHLISNLNSSKESKTINGMCYNPVTMRWEGNENALSAFDPPASSPSTASLPPYMLREKENATPRPALITPIGATKGVQVVGGMVFDPQNMCWLKLGPQSSNRSDVDDPMEGFNAIDSDEDVFKDIPDLDDTADTTEVGAGRVSDIKDDWLVGEEFDVGPEFIKRQREEEQRWKKKCERWMTYEDRDRNAFRWLLRDMIMAADRP